MWVWQRLHLWERSLTGCLFGSIHIHHDPLLTQTIAQAAWRGERLAGHKIFLEERAQCLHRHLIKGGKKAREGRARGQVMATKERHKGARKGLESLIKGFEGGLTAEGIPISTTTKSTVSYRPKRARANRTRSGMLLRIPVEAST